MKRLMYSFIISISLLFIGCGHQVKEENIKDINGYWEIEKVKLPDGSEKDYDINTTVDFFELDSNGKGFRKKVMPQIDGSYETNDVVENVQVKKEKDEYWIEYKTEYASWKEQLLSIDQNNMVVKNTHNLTYTYKRPIPFSKK